MRGSDLDPDRLPTGTGVQAGGEGPQRLGQHHVRATVEDAGDLLVPLDGHRGDHPLGAHLLEDDAHLHGQRTHPVPAEPPVHLGRDPCGGELGQALLRGLLDGVGAGAVVCHGN